MKRSQTVHCSLQNDTQSVKPFIASPILKALDLRVTLCKSY